MKLLDERQIRESCSNPIPTEKLCGTVLIPCGKCPACKKEEERVNQLIDRLVKRMKEKSR